MSEDLLFSAAFDDKTQAFFDQFNANVNAMKSGAQGANQEMQGGSQQSATALGFVAGAVAGITSKLTEMAFQAAKAFPDLIVQSTKLAAAAEVTETALIKVSANAGITKDEIVGVRDEMVKMTFAEASANDALLRLVGSQTDLATATKLATAALDISTVIGRSEEETLQRLINAGITGNQIVLRSLQLSKVGARARKEMQKAAEDQGVAVADLNREQFFYNAIIEESAKFQGSYASASEQAGTEAEELTEKTRDLQRAFGETFIPAYLVWIQMLRDNVVELKTWFEENQDEVKAWGALLKESLETALALITMVGKAATLFGDILTAVVVSSAKGLTVLMGRFDTMNTTLEEIGTTARQLGVILISSLKGASTYLSGFIDALRGPIGEFPERIATAWNDALEVQNSTFIELSKKWGLIESAAKDTEEAINNDADATKKFAEELEKVIDVIKKVNAAFAEESETLGIKRTREGIDAAIREARQREDIARNHAERIEQIQKNAAARRSDVIADARKDERELIEEQAEERARLEKDNAQSMLDIEIDYRRRLEDIQTNFEADQHELARKNDAVGLLRLMRDTKRKLAEEEKSRDRNIEDAQKSFEQEKADLASHQAEQREKIRDDLQERLAEFEENLAEQLQAAVEQRDKNIENLERSLRRQQEDTTRHRQWQDEDRARSHQKELTELGAHFADVEGMTAAHLQMILEQHGAAIQGLDVLWGAFRGRQRANYNPGVTPGAGEWGIPVPGQNLGQYANINRNREGAAGEWGFERGGAMVATRPTTVNLAENGQAEAFAAMPLGGTVNHRLSGNASLDVNGVSPELESQIKPLLYSAITDLVRNVRRN